MGTQSQGTGHRPRKKVPEPDDPDDPDPVVREIPVYLSRSMFLHYSSPSVSGLTEPNESHPTLTRPMRMPNATSNAFPPAKKNENIRTYLVQYPLEPRTNGLMSNNNTNTNTNSTTNLKSSSSSLTLRTTTRTDTLQLTKPTSTATSNSKSTPAPGNTIVGLKFKPMQEKLQVSVSVNRSINYDMDREKRLLRNRKRTRTKNETEDSEGSEDEDADEHLKLLPEPDSCSNKKIPDPRTRILESTQIPRCSDGSKISKRFALGYECKRTGAFYLCPVNSVLQMKPKLTYGDPEMVGEDVEEGVVGETGEDQVPVPTKVTLRFKQTRDYGGGGHGSYTTRHPKFDAWKSRKDSEPWMDLELSKGQDKDSRTHSLAPKSQKLTCVQEEQKLLSLPIPSTSLEVIPADEYLKFLIPKTKELMIDEFPSLPLGQPVAEFSEMSTCPPSQISMQTQKSFPFSDQLRILFLKGHLFTYRQIVTLLKTKLNVFIDDLNLLKAIQAVAVLVQGCWIVKSDLLYPKDLNLQRARDLVLNQYNNSRVHPRSKLCTLAHIPADTLTQIITPFAQSNPVKSAWEFKLPFDREFVNLYPDIQTRQKLMWDIKNSSRIRRESEHQQQVERAQQKQIQEQAAQKAKSLGIGTRRRNSKSRSRNSSFSSTISTSSVSSSTSVSSRVAAAGGAVAAEAKKTRSKSRFKK